MTVNILAFGIARDIVGGSSLRIEVGDAATVGELKAVLEERYPALRQLASLLIAQDAEFASPADPLRQGSELALIPPVSGG